MKHGVKFVQLEGVELWRGDAKRLHVPNLTLSTGAPTLVMGPNGAGKSLLLRLIHDLEQADVGQMTRADGIKQAMVFQRPVLLRRSVSANIDLVLKRQGLRGAARVQALDDWLAKARLREHADQPARSLSGGEQQRLCLIRALATGPDVLLLDEPTANLDPSATRDIEALIKDAQAEGITIVMVTHDIGQAKRLGGQLVFLNQGHIVEQGALAQRLQRPETNTLRRFLAGELLV